VPVQDRSLYRLFLIILLITAALGLSCQGPRSALNGFLLLQQHPARLINDFTVVGGTGGALLNAAGTGAISLLLVFVASVRLSGPTIAAIFTIMGFSLFGKTPVNILPIILGVFAAGHLVGKPFKGYILIALFGTALGPLTTYLAYEAGFSGIPALLAAGMGGFTAGLILPSLAMAMLRMHEGFNLYNIGLTCGFFGLFAASLLVALNRDLSISIIWNNEPSLLLTLLVPGLSLLLAGWGIVMDGVAGSLKGLKKIHRLSGRLPSDFMELVSPGATLVNAGLLGLAGSAYIYFVGADFNGPVIGGLLTIIGFATFGKHLKNSLPVVFGVAAATLLFGKSLTAPGPVLALLFGTTLAPLAGEFGPLTGFIAGFLHLLMVERTAAWHGGLDLYNNGFAGGLVATFMVAVIEWYRSNKNNTSIRSRKRTT
jgi:Protein of unknown function (DUF1576)